MTFVHKSLIAGAFGATLALGAAVGVAVADQPFMHSALDICAMPSAIWRTAATITAATA
jgi:hypothetical protein